MAKNENPTEKLNVVNVDPAANAKNGPEKAAPPKADPDDTQSHVKETVKARAERSRLSKLSKEELVDIILEQKGMKAIRLSQSTSQMDLEDPTVSFGKIAFGTKISTDVRKYVRMPEDVEPIKELTWRIKFVSNNPIHAPMGIEICADVILGRPLGDIKPDLDLSEFDAAKVGVSRHHALLRPSRTNIFLIDLGSTNGTYRNGQRLSKGVAQTLHDRDIVSLGALHFAVRIVERPSG